MNISGKIKVGDIVEWIEGEVPFHKFRVTKISDSDLWGKPLYPSVGKIHGLLIEFRKVKP